MRMPEIGKEHNQYRDDSRILKVIPYETDHGFHACMTVVLFPFLFQRFWPRIGLESF